ncbi:MAG: O-antigen ligase family protein [Candidatus Brocadiales bacterium]|nr:O-antigen ligase family protein [Candidatus Brocadiales bacterium]
MIFFLISVVILITALTSFTMPWVGVIAYNVVSLLQPQSIWFWAFQGFSVFKIFAGISFFSFIIAIAKKSVDFSILKNKQNLAILIIFIMVHLSDIFSPFDVYYGVFGAKFLFATLNPVIIFYFITQLTLNGNENHLRYMIYAFIGILLYYIYWSNDAYFNFDVTKFTQQRLNGPLYSPYFDENKFAVLFVIGFPFLVFGYFYTKKIIPKLGLGIAAALSLHSIFLTGSRGGLLAIGICTLMIAKLIQSKKYSIIMILAFIIALSLYGGSVLFRSEQTINAAQSEEEVNPRLRSWTIGYEIIKQYPILGVGASRFQHASIVMFPEFNSSYVAHNTFFQIASNSGLLAGILYLWIYYYNIKIFRRAVKNNISQYPFLDYANKSIFVSLSGFYFCSIFLDMLIFEGYYFLLILSITTHHIFLRKSSNQTVASKK